MALALQQKRIHCNANRASARAAPGGIAIARYSRGRQSFVSTFLSRGIDRPWKLAQLSLMRETLGPCHLS